MSAVRGAWERGVVVVKAYLTAYGDGAVREVELPVGAESMEEARLLEAAFWHGQNEKQPRPMPSVSVGDVLELPGGKRFRVAMVGFVPLDQGDDPLALRGLDAVEAGICPRRRGDAR